MTTNRRLRLGTRSSKLARWQAQWVAERLVRLSVDVELVSLTTQGDVKTGPVEKIGGQGVFTKEIQRALLDGAIDLAVHSLKDLPTEPVAGLSLAAVPPREDAADVLVATAGRSLDQLARACRVGTGSLRRKAQLLHVRDDLVVEDIRGNVDTRLRKLDEGQYDAIVLAKAGLTRLGLGDRITQVLPKTMIYPAVGQGALGIETRADDHATREILLELDDPATRAAVTAERTMLAELRGGCLAPVGAWGWIERDGQLCLDAVVLSADGKQRIQAAASGEPASSAQVGASVAGKLLELGASQLIAAARR